MIKMINKITGTEMWVDESREIEYTSFGHRYAVPDLEDMKRKKPAKEEIIKELKRTTKKKV